MTYILALDQGTSSTRAIVFALDGHICARAQEELTQYYPHNGWVEHDAEEIWQSQLRVAHTAIKQSGKSISTIGITNQRETIVIWERDSGKPIHHALVWQDRRTSDHCAQLIADGHQQFVRERTGLLLDPYFSATKIAWILDHVSGARQRAENGELACGTIDSWLAWNLSKGQNHITDVSNASRTSLLNIHSGDWDDELLQLFQVPKQLLPEIHPSACEYFHCNIFGSSIPVAGIAGDQQAALFGQRCTTAGMVKCTYGTGAFIMAQCEQQAPVADGLLSTIAWQIHDQPMQYALEGAVFSAGSSVQWLRDNLGIIDTASDIEKLAADNSDDVFFIPAFNGLGTPYWDPHARA
ncbi:MAG: glycerol kinase GlpK, partial [Planctomycetes bacterium]|nr:glycerol kinase GlpK [Planctomycetota bacterium]